MGVWKTGLVVAMLSALLAGCGDDDVSTSNLKDGRATGPGYSYALPDGWKSLDLGDKADRELAERVSERIKGLDTAGFGYRYWAKPGDDERRPIVNVTAEPLTADTETDIAARSGRALMDTLGPDIQDAPLAPPAQFDKAPTLVGVRYSAEGRANRAVSARRGTYVYTVTVSMQEKYAKDVDALTESIATSWRWAALDAAGRRALEPLRRLQGDGYRVRLPLGWRGSGKAALKAMGGAFAGADTLWRGAVTEQNSTNATVLISPGASGTLDAAASEVEDAERQTAEQTKGAYVIRGIERGTDTTVGDEPAAVLEIRSAAGPAKVPLRQREVIFRHAGRTYRVILTSLPGRFAKDLAEFDSALATWAWVR
ncbi:hypothetical protein DSM112329_02143 [Paraconexibacter sp. AEG42_29]|uniref:Lipoprotein n=1 Tax=Paraconexibacter sp. AEG42_29 TaxID=2997339 RepID=A0AAU7AUC0_9ACTN